MDLTIEQKRKYYEAHKEAYYLTSSDVGHGEYNLLCISYSEETVCKFLKDYFLDLYKGKLNDIEDKRIRNCNILAILNNIEYLMEETDLYPIDFEIKTIEIS